MKILYFEAQDGISGDMTLGALIDLGADIEKIREELDKFVPEPYGLAANGFQRNGITGVNLDVIVDGHGCEAAEGTQMGGTQKEPSPLCPHDGHAHTHTHDGYAHTHTNDGHAHTHTNDWHTHSHGSGHGHHRSHSDIREMIEKSGITDRAKRYALDIFAVIAEGEAAVHGIPADEVAFHEVGAMDSIIDIVGTAIAVDLLDAEGFYCTALHDGSGGIVCRHGLIPVPVPAVMEMAQGSGIPIVIEDNVTTEMITPTGFGIIKGLNCKYVSKLPIAVDKVGYGFGKRDTGRLGALRVTLGRLAEG
jgi:uncharacterized protein (DUF111 family)